ncbi:MAG TPA: hypothetical protein VJU16_04200, partial [Planctomycetota bacterium]|nr:hypothetical protein [Planctomycetota bacterium]
AVLSLIAVTFAILNSVDRDNAANYRLTTQARLVARAGVEHAVSRLTSSQALASALVDGGDWTYYGNDMSGTDPYNRYISLLTAKRPSYAIMGGPAKPEQVRILHEGKQVLSVGVSGRITGGEFVKGGDQYALEVRDLSGCIFVNDGLKMQGGNKSSVSENLRRILNALGREPKVGVVALGDRIIDNRPPEGFASWHHFVALMKKGAGLKDEDLERLERFLTVHAWVDTNVVNPVPFSRLAAAQYPVRYNRGDSMVFRRGPGKDFRGRLRDSQNELGWIEEVNDRPAIPGTTAVVYGLDELFPGYVEVVHRAPVNVNSATVEVLIALLADLRGVYLQERRSSSPMDPAPPSISYQSSQWIGPANFEIPQGNYTWEYMGHTYSPDSWPAPRSVNENKKWSDPRGATTQMPEEQDHMDVPDRDELGYLVATTPLVAEGTAGGYSARAVAEEIVACRESQGDYAGLPFGGPFKTWAQFHAFCDYLAQSGVLRDPRYGDGYMAKQANQAFADVLKANFNPNFTPNEINPDRNLFLMVDKTDLIVNSTEFCFLPTGYFQVNAIARILRESKNKEAPDGGKVLEVAAQAGAKAVVRVHELYRETSQRHFYRGESPLVKPAGRTSNGRTIESGPEPDNGPLLYGDHFNHAKLTHTREQDGDALYYEPGAEIQSGWGYEASGYLALPTIGGPDEFKAPNTMVPTSPAVTPQDEHDGDLHATPRMHAHFRYDDRL